MPGNKRRRTNDRPSGPEDAGIMHDSGHRQNHGSGNGYDGDFSFVLDTHGEELKEDVHYAPDGGLSKGDEPEDPNASGLLLPGNVRVLEAAEANASTNEPAEDSEDDDMGHFDVLDDGPNSVARYYEEKKEAAYAKRECPVCGEDGHDKKNCPHTHCVSCGALDEHTTRECPLAIICNRCGLSGHIARDCPNRRAPGRLECPLCFSTNHPETACPTLWRSYRYVSPEDHDRARTLEAARQVAAQERADDAGSSDMDRSEADDDEYKKTMRPPRPDWDPALRWCYNCSMSDNHWGDDCPDIRANPLRTTGEPSCFSERVSLMGPFAEHLEPPPPVESVGGLPSTNFTFRAGENTDFLIDGDELLDGYFERKKRNQQQAGPGRGQRGSTWQEEQWDQRDRESRRDGRPDYRGRGREDDVDSWFERRPSDRRRSPPRRHHSPPRRQRTPPRERHDSRRDSYSRNHDDRPPPKQGRQGPPAPMSRREQERYDERARHPPPPPPSGRKYDYHDDRARPPPPMSRREQERIEEEGRRRPPAPMSRREQERIEEENHRRPLAPMSRRDQERVEEEARRRPPAPMSRREQERMEEEARRGPPAPMSRREQERIEEEARRAPPPALLTRDDQARFDKPTTPPRLIARLDQGPVESESQPPPSKRVKYDADRLPLTNGARPTSGIWTKFDQQIVEVHSASPEADASAAAIKNEVGKPIDVNGMTKAQRRKARARARDAIKYASSSNFEQYAPLGPVGGSSTADANASSSKAPAQERARRDDSQRPGQDEGRTSTVVYEPHSSDEWSARRRGEAGPQYRGGYLD